MPPLVSTIGAACPGTSWSGGHSDKTWGSWPIQQCQAKQWLTQRTHTVYVETQSMLPVPELTWLVVTAARADWKLQSRREKNHKSRTLKNTIRRPSKDKKTQNFWKMESCWWSVDPNSLGETAAYKTHRDVVSRLGSNLPCRTWEKTWTQQYQSSKSMKQLTLPSRIHIKPELLGQEVPFSICTMPMVSYRPIFSY